LASFFAGADALGFVFYKKSPRYITPLKAREISRILPKRIARVGVFVDAPVATVKRIAKLCALDMLQFHGKESCEYCRKFKDYKVIKAFRIARVIDLAKLAKYKTCAYLFDTYSQGKKGGTGKRFNWKLLAQTARIEPLVFLSGGLTVNNVSRAVKLLKPGWVDVSSSLEIKPGQKDHQKIKKFIQIAKRA